MGFFWVVWGVALHMCAETWDRKVVNILWLYNMDEQIIFCWALWLT